MRLPNDKIPSQGGNNATQFFFSFDGEIKVIPQYCTAHPTIHEFCVISARNERVHVHNERFPQAKLDSEINACFLLTEHGSN